MDDLGIHFSRVVVFVEILGFVVARLAPGRPLFVEQRLQAAPASTPVASDAETEAEIVELALGVGLFMGMLLFLTPVFFPLSVLQIKTIRKTSITF